MTIAVDETHDPHRCSWVETANGHRDFPIQNLPLGIFSTIDSGPRGGVAIGDYVLDVAALAQSGNLSGEALHAAKLLTGSSLNGLLAHPQNIRQTLRHTLSEMLSNPSWQSQIERMLHHSQDCRMHLPAAIGDYTDFYTGIHHATNVGRLFRPEMPLLPNYRHIPIGYHGRASSIVPSGTDVCRPSGQVLAESRTEPTFVPTTQLDYEVELAVWINGSNALGRPIPLDHAEHYIAGIGLLNDWSARDLQRWEYQPLGPFLAKSFATSVSSWVVTSEALAPFRRAHNARTQSDPDLLAYLIGRKNLPLQGYAIAIDASILTAQMRQDRIPAYRLSQCSAMSMYWTVAQLITHHTSNGCNLRPGDIFGTGTISDPTDSGKGSLLEITNGGKEAITLPSGEQRRFLADGDEVIFSAQASAPNAITIGFGECRGIVRATGCTSADADDDG